VEDRSVTKTCIYANYEIVKKTRSVVSSDNRPSIIVPEANNYQDLHDDSNTAYGLRVVDVNSELSQSTSLTVIFSVATAATQREYRAIVISASKNLVRNEVSPILKRKGRVLVQLARNPLVLDQYHTPVARREN
jgi:hypothetical protein